MKCYKQWSSAPPFSLPRATNDDVVHQSILWSPLSQPEVMEIDCDQKDATFDTSSLKLCEEAKESGDEILVEQAEALGIQFDYDGSVLTPEQKRALLKNHWALLCEIFELRSPHKNVCASQTRCKRCEPFHSNIAMAAISQLCTFISQSTIPFDDSLGDQRRNENCKSSRFR